MQIVKYYEGFYTYLLKSIRDIYDKNIKKYDDDLQLIKKFDKQAFNDVNNLLLEYKKQYQIYTKNIYKVLLKGENNDKTSKICHIIKERFLQFDNSFITRYENFVTPILLEIKQKYQKFVLFENGLKKINKFFDIFDWLYIEDKEILTIEHNNKQYNLLLESFEILNNLKHILIELINNEENINHYELICQNIIEYNLKRLMFDKIIQGCYSPKNLIYKVKYNKIFKEFDAFNLDNYILTNEETNKIIEIFFNFNQDKIQNEKITDFEKFKTCSLKQLAKIIFSINDLDLILKINQENQKELTNNYFKKYKILSMIPKLETINNNDIYATIIYDSYQEKINNCIENDILNEIKANKDEYLKIFNDNLIKLFNNQKYGNVYSIEDMITINNHFLALYVNLDNDYNPYLVLSSLLTIFNIYKYNIKLKDNLNFAHTYLIKYKNETIKLITYLIKAHEYNIAGNLDTYNNILKMLENIINNNQNKDILYFITAKIEELANCMQNIQINEDLLFNNNYYPFDKVNTKNIQLEFELNMQPFYQDYIKTKVKSKKDENK